MTAQTQEKDQAAKQLIDNMNQETQALIHQKDQQIISLEKEIISMKSKALRVYEENEMIKSNPTVAAMKAEMDYHLSVADRFIKGKAFKCENAEQAYTIIMAGKELGLGPVESMNALYIVNGSINPHGKFMVSRLTDKGYKIEYLEESDSGVTVKVTSQDGKHVISERVTDKDQILQKSRAMGFAKKNKMRFHGIRMVINFHLAHLFGSVSDMFVEQYREEEDSIKPYQIQKMMDEIASFDNINDLEAYYEENKATISKDINLTMQIGRLRKQLIPEDAEMVESDNEFVEASNQQELGWDGHKST